MSKLYDVTPNALTGGGIFSILDSSAYDVPWGDDVIALQLDMEYYGNVSGEKITSPLVDKLLEDCELTTAGMAQLAQVVYSLNFRRWDKEWQTQLAEYDPISNYDMTEEMSEEGSTQYGHTRLRTDNLAHTETRTDNLQHVVDASEVETPAVTTTEQDSVRAFNSGSDQPSNKRTQSASGTNRKDNDVTEHDTGTQSTTGSNTGTQSDAEGGEDVNEREYTLTRRGNIGVTTSQQMLTSERDLWMWNFFYEIVFPDVDKILTSPIYMIDAATAAAGGFTPEGEISINRNGVYNVSRYASALVNVSNSYTEADEGKVVNNGALVNQTSREITANGIFGTTYNNSVSVNVPNSYSEADEGKVVNNGALVNQTSREITANGIFDTTYNNSVNIDVPLPVRYQYVGWFTPASDAGRALSGGWKFTPFQDLLISGLRFFARASEAIAYISDVNGNTITSKTATGLTVGAWNDIDFDEPVTLSEGVTYVVWGSNVGATMKYYNRSISPELAQFDGALWGSNYNTFPTTTESGATYGVDLIVEVLASCNVYFGSSIPIDSYGYNGDYYILPADQSGAHIIYYKVNGTWILI